MSLNHARHNMIEQQIRPWAVLDETVLDTFRFLPREKFVPANWQKLAFADIEIPLAHRESMMHPRVEARMLQELAVQATDQCLEIGTGSGFVTACLAHLGDQVDSVDIHADFSRQAEEHLLELSLANVSLYTDDASNGWQGLPGKLYDVIAVTGSLPEYTPAFEQRLAPGGRLFVITGKHPVMHALLVTREDKDNFNHKVLFETILKPLSGSSSEPVFQF